MSFVQRSTSKEINGIRVKKIELYGIIVVL